MAEVKGKFITLTGALMSVYKDALEEADKNLFAAIKKHWNELDLEGWYDTKLFNTFMLAYANASPTKENAIVTLGRNVYPTIKRTSKLPDNLKSPLDFIKFEPEGFLANHRGADVRPRKIISVKEGDVVMEATAPGYQSKLNVGVYLGILEMCGVKTGQVEQTKFQEKGDKTSEFHITW
jgi:hypothetical protein